MTDTVTGLAGPRPDGSALRDPFLDVRPGDRWLVAVAHPDDESFGCGSLIARASALGAEVTVACATRGEAGEPQPGAADGGDQHHDLGAVREAELHRASARLGVARVELLGYRDSGFDGDPGPGTLCAAPVQELTALLGRLLSDLRPAVVVVLDGSDGHRDHLRVRSAVRAAVESLAESLPEALPGQPATEPRGVAPLLVEHCLTNALMRRWLEEMRALRPDTAYHGLDPASLGRPDTDITDVVDVSAVLPQREAAMAEHRSQASPFDGLSPGLRRAFLATDHVVRLSAGPTGVTGRASAGERSR